MPTAPLVYVMRGVINSPPYQDVTWRVYGTPDLTGAQSGYSNLINIIVDYTITNEDGGISATPLDISMSMAGDVTGTSGASIVNMSGDVTGRTSANTVGKIQNTPLNISNPTLNQTLLWNGTQWINATFTLAPASGDLAGNYPAPTVTGLQGRPVNSVAPTGGQTLAWNGATNKWEPMNLGISGGDLSGTYALPYIKSISGNNGGGGTVTLNVNGLQFAAGQTNPTISQADSGSNSITIQAQNNTSGISGNGGSVNIIAGSANSNGSFAGDVNISAGGNLANAFSGNVNINGGGGTFVNGDVNINGGHVNSGIYGNVNVGSGNTQNITIAVRADSNHSFFNFIKLNGGAHFTDPGQALTICFTTPTIDATKLNLGGSNFTYTTTTSATAGANGDVPAQVAGYLTININGTDYKLPFYNT